MSEVKPERTGWRDLGLSKLHRQWGHGMPLVDIDFLPLYYDYGKPIAVVEYKREDAQAARLSHPSYVALGRLESGGRALPFFVVRYATNFSWFAATGGNDAASKKISDASLMDGQRMPQDRWVRFLYWLKGEKMPEDVAANILRTV